jgi:glycosyltransferase involved in cell wall biosynthesis
VKIVQVVHYFLPRHVAGTEVYTYTLSKALMSRGHRVRIYTREDGFSDREFAEAETTYDDIPVRTVYFNRRGVRAGNVLHAFYLSISNPVIDQSFDLFLHEFRPDLVHFQHTDGLSASMVAVASRHRIPVVFTLHDYWSMCHRTQLITPDLEICDGPASGAKCAACIDHPMVTNRRFERAIRTGGRLAGIYRARFMRAMLLKADLLISPSEFLRRRFIEFGVPADKILLLDNGLSVERFGGVSKRPSSRVRFGYIGAVIVHKGLHLLVEAFNRLPVGKAELLIYGDSTVTPAYYESVKENVRHPDIRFMGTFNNRDVPEIMAGIDALVIPSIWPENSPLTIHEAFLARVPVIAPRVGGIPELVHHERNGVLFETGSAADLQTRMEHLLHNPRLLQTYAGNIGRIKSIQENAKELEEVYEQLAGTRAGRLAEAVAS